MNTELKMSYDSLERWRAAIPLVHGTYFITINDYSKEYFGLYFTTSFGKHYYFEITDEKKYVEFLLRYM